VDAPQAPDAEAAASSTGGQPPGQASAFRRALDAQVTIEGQSPVFVPAGPHDLTAPIDITSLRDALAAESQHAAHPLRPMGPIGSCDPLDPQDPTVVFADVPLPQSPAQPPSASGPTVVVPAVSVPALRVNTTIAAVSDAAPVPADAAGAGKPPDDSPRRHRGGNGKPSRLPTAVGVSALMATVFAVALVMLANGHSGAPLAPTALPTKSDGHTPARNPAHSAAPSHKPSPPPVRSHSASASTSPKASASASATAAPNGPAGPATRGHSPVPTIATITWTNGAEPIVQDIQLRLASLHYLMPVEGGSQFAMTQRTYNEVQWHAPPDGFGYYQNATDSAIRAFEYDYLQHHHGQLPSGGCSNQTYQALVNATS